jgi:hypothetical protein
MHTLARSGRKSYWSVYKLNAVIPFLTDISVDILVDNFWADIFALNKNKTIRLKLTVNFGSRVLSLSKLQYANFENTDKIKDVLKGYLADHVNSYSDLNISNVYIDYHVMDTKIESVFKSHPRNITQKVFKFIKPKSLPLTMDLYTWGDELLFYANYTIASWTIDTRNYIFQIMDKFYKCIVSVHGVIISEFEDHLDDTGNLSTFTRIIQNKCFKYVNGELVLFKQTLKNNFIPKLILKFKGDKEREALYKKNDLTKFLSLDLETRVLANNSIEVICASIYDIRNLELKSFYITDFKDSSDLIDNLIEFLLTNYGKDKLVIYIHDLSYIDEMFLLKHLAKYTLSDIIRKDGKLIQVNVKVDTLSITDTLKKKSNNKISIKFNDSNLLLPASLSNLSQSFGVEMKESFDFELLNDPNLDLSSIKQELLKYNQLNCKILSEVIHKFSVIIFDLFKLNIHSYPTISSLALAIFRSHFTMKENINITSYEVHSNIRSGYTGGHVDVYKAYGENLYYYNINSLYSYVMANNPFPVGKCIYFEGRRALKDLFGIVLVNITAPEDLEVPILLTKTRAQGKIETLAPLGKWTGWYFTEELKNATKYGYKIEVLRGYIYESDNIFSSYINTLYNMRLKYPKTNVLNRIFKLLQYSLYGRLGMTLLLEKNRFINLNSILEDKCSDAEKKAFEDMSDLIEFGNGYALLSNEVRNNLELNRITNVNVSLPVAMAVAAYARMYMADIKIKYKDNLYYSDTDSLILDCELPNHLVGDKLGQFKLEHVVKRGIFLGPKFYSIQVLNEEGDIIDITKVKGYKDASRVTLDSLYELLTPGKELNLNQDKWFRDVNTSTILIKDNIYSQIVNENKRQWTFKDGKYFKTTPHIINELFDF